jgi:hypothetical protein
MSGMSTALLAALHDCAHDCGQHGADDTAAANRTCNLGDVESTAPTAAEEATEEATSQTATHCSGDAVTSGTEVILGACDSTADESTDDAQYPFHLFFSLGDARCSV